MKKECLNIDEKSCYGCTACLNVCPRKAISMKENSEGFLYPSIDKEKCINCGLCTKICPFISKYNKNDNTQEFYAAQASDQDVLMKSSSGGLFYTFSNYVLKKDGYVCGAVFDDDFTVIHILSNKKTDILRMMGSKYVQSNLNNVFIGVKSKLESGNMVLFTGTPCQVAGLKKYLLKDYDNLITVDLICHGTPSQKIFDEYIKFLNKDLINYKFRDKEKNGWSFAGSIKYKKDNKILEKNILSTNDSYMNLYLNNLIYRKPCYDCKFASINRVSDITIGDCWNVDGLSNYFNEKKGVSLLITNTKKGSDFFKNIESDLKIVKISINDIKKENNNLFSPTGYIPERDLIYDEFVAKGFSYVAKKYCKFSYFIPFLKRHTPKFIKNYLKRRGSK